MKNETKKPLKIGTEIKPYGKIKDVKGINNYTETAYSKLPLPEQSKVFYSLDEWSGWRFYLKALRYKDFRSILHHIKRSYF